MTGSNWKMGWHCPSSCECFAVSWSFHSVNRKFGGKFQRRFRTDWRRSANLHEQIIMHWSYTVDVPGKYVVHIAHDVPFKFKLILSGLVTVWCDKDSRCIVTVYMMVQLTPIWRNRRPQKVWTFVYLEEVRWPHSKIFMVTIPRNMAKELHAASILSRYRPI